MSVLGFLIMQSVIHLNYCQRNRPTYPPRYKDLAEDYKKKHKNYNPTYGYEPYWIDGSWVFDENLPENGSTTSMPQVCGEECNYLYREIGQVCGRLSSNKYSKGCNSWFYCYGDILDDLTEGFQTFDTYCKFLDTQCRSSFEHRWILVHSGPCIERQELSFKPMSSGDEPVSRMDWYFTELENSLKNHTTLPPLDKFPNK